MIKVSKYLICFWGLLLSIYSCKAQKWPDYISKLPQSQSYTYVEAGEWNAETSIDTLTAKLWYDSSEKSNAVFITPTDLVKVRDRYWICDPMVGAVFEFDCSGSYIRTIAKRGRGPNETVKPSAMFVFSKEGKERVYVTDPAQKSILVFDEQGNEKQRIAHATIDRSLFSNWIVALSDNSLIWPTYALQEHVLVEADTNGVISRSFIERLIPMGYQPATHNGVVYDNNPLTKQDVYAYRGLPLFFSRNGDKKYMINLLPNTKLEEINTSLKTLPAQTQVSVKILVKDIYRYQDKVLIHFRNKLLAATTNGSQVQGFAIVDSLNRTIIPQKVTLAGDDLFFIDRFNLKIYKLPISRIPDF